ncbi:PH domain-containing protein [Methanocella sp. MCL-LM]|uniref:PH domain-containing protein n=1 Tax=Methanocella sp. MCL-LM TaxID=3412035 RepID=UPI003C720076
MRDEPEHRLDSRAVNYWRLAGVISAVIYWAVVVSYWYASSLWQVLPGWVTAGLAVLALIGSAYEILIVPTVRWNTWRYEISDMEIYLRHGVVVKHRTLIPMTRVQHVDTVKGPLLGLFGLATVTIATAAGNHEIPALSDSDAASLRDRIAELARVTEEDAG